MGGISALTGGAVYYVPIMELSIWNKPWPDKAVRLRIWLGWLHLLWNKDKDLTPFLTQPWPDDSLRWKLLERWHCPSTEHSTHCAQCSVLNTEHTAHCAQCLMLNTEHTAHCAQCSVLNTEHTAHCAPARSNTAPVQWALSRPACQQLTSQSTVECNDVTPTMALLQ